MNPRMLGRGGTKESPFQRVTTTRTPLKKFWNRYEETAELLQKKMTVNFKKKLRMIRIKEICVAGV